MCNIINNPNKAYAICQDCGQYLPANATSCDACNGNAYRERWFLMDEDFSSSPLDSCLAYSHDEAWDIFVANGWVIGTVISESDYMAECQLNALENQSPE